MNNSTTGTATTLNTPTMANTQCAHLSKILPQDGDLFSPYVVNCVIMCVLSVTAVIGNILILVSICRAPQFLRQPSYFLLVNLAFADLCVGFIAEPLYVMYKISYLSNPLSILFCYAGNVFNFFSYLLTSLSLWTAAAISLDRLLALLLHMKYTAIVTKWRVLVLIAVLLALSFAFASMFEWALDAQNTVFVCANSVALLTALLSYVRIFQIVRYHQRQISSHQLGEISFTDRCESDSMGTSFHGQEIREQLKGVRVVRGTAIPSDNKQATETGTQGKERFQSTDRKDSSLYDQKSQEKVSSESGENHRRFSESKDLECRQKDKKMKNAETNDRSKSNEQHLAIDNTVIPDNVSQLVRTTQENSHFNISSGVTNNTAFIDISVLEELDQKAESREEEEEEEEEEQQQQQQQEKVEQEEQEEESKHFQVEKGSSESRRDDPVCNSELGMTEMQRLNTSREQQNNLKGKELQSESCALGEKLTETRSLENEKCFTNLHQNQNVTTAETTFVASQETQDLKDETIATPAITVDQHGINANNETINDNQIIINRKKRFRMRHFKKSFYNMFVIWFLMLLCYLPSICTSILVMFIGRSYSMHLAFTFTTSVMFLNSSINPIVFCWRIREFRAAVKKTLKELFGFWSNQSGRHNIMTRSSS